MKKTSLILTIGIALLLSAFMIGCGADEADVDTLDEGEADVESLYKELVGTYELLRAEVTYVDQPKQVLEPPQVVGTMTISSDRIVTQKFEILGVPTFATGSFEILPDEGIMLLKTGDVTVRTTYTWDEEILTTTADFESVVEKDFWRKLNNTVIELQPPEPPPPAEEPPSAEFVSAIPANGSELAANGVITLIFSSDPGDVVSSAGTVVGAGKTRSVSGPFAAGALTLNINWTNGDGATSLTYTVKAPDNRAPEVTGGTVRDGDEDVDPDAINNEGVIMITFDEEVVGNIALQTVGGDDVGWIGRVEGNEAWLELVAGKEIRNKTTYVIKGIVSDAAGNQTFISITFETQ